MSPDITVVCDRSKLDDRGCKGSPDLIIEIYSKDNEVKVGIFSDLIIKFNEVFKEDLI